MYIADAKTSKHINAALERMRSQLTFAEDSDGVTVGLAEIVGALQMLHSLGIITFQGLVNEMEKIVTIANERDKELRECCAKINVPFSKAL